MKKFAITMAIAAITATTALQAQAACCGSDTDTSLGKGKPTVPDFGSNPMPEKPEIAKPPTPAELRNSLYEKFPAARPKPAVGKGPIPEKEKIEHLLPAPNKNTPDNFGGLPVKPTTASSFGIK